MMADAVALAIASVSAAVLFVLWISVIFALRRTSPRSALLAALILPAPPLAWRAGLRVRAVMMALLAVLYVGVRLVFG